MASAKRARDPVDEMHAAALQLSASLDRPKDLDLMLRYAESFLCNGYELKDVGSWMISEMSTDGGDDYPWSVIGWPDDLGFLVNHTAEFIARAVTWLYPVSARSTRVPWHQAAELTFDLMRTHCIADDNIALRLLIEWLYREKSHSAEAISEWCFTTEHDGVRDVAMDFENDPTSLKFLHEELKWTSVEITEYGMRYASSCMSNLESLWPILAEEAILEPDLPPDDPYYGWDVQKFW